MSQRVSALLGFLLFLSSTALAQSVSLNLSPRTGSPGNTVALNLSLSNNGGAQPAGLQWTIMYSASEFSAVSVSTGSAASAAGKTVSCSSASGSMVCLVTGFNTNTISNGVVAVVNATIVPGTLVSSPPVQISNTAAVSAAGNAIPMTGTINSPGAVNVASYVTTVAAGSIAGVFGSDLSIGQSGSQVSTPLPTTLGQSSYTIGGHKAPLYFASPGQVTLQIPWELAGQTQVPIRGTVDGLGSNTQVVNLAPFAPGIFTIDSTGTGQGAVLIVPTAQLAAPDTPVLRGEYVSIFCTGLGPVTNQPPTGAPAQADPLSLSLTTPTVTIGDVEARVSYSGLAPGFAGLYQVNAEVPTGVSPANAVPVVISVGGATSNTVTIAVQ